MQMALVEVDDQPARNKTIAGRGISAGEATPWSPSQNERSSSRCRSSQPETCAARTRKVRCSQNLRAKQLVLRVT